MVNQKINIPEKGAAVQKDRETYAISPYLPGGLVDPDTLRKIADISEKYGAKFIKLTSEHRITIYGIPFEDIDNVWNDLGMEPGGLSGKIVRPVKFCIGSSSCKMAKQNTLELGMEIDKHFRGIKTPDKMKIAISGCENSCAEPAVRDIGLIGTHEGWNILVGGNAGIQPRLGTSIAKNLSAEEVLDLMSKIISYYKENEEKTGLSRRLGKFIDSYGFNKFSKEIL
ncbi:NAD(P)/FAD-dependent oxidoreductase [Methanobacterium sp.]|uniref:NAD(P)/FAD-dependent oxidoreductase n=1 Tax=Methanobacterium sp. TaxID=2164 RepID=UPI003C71D48F